MQLPDQFIKRTKSLFGEIEYESFREALEEDSSVSIRVNRNKLDFSSKGLIPVPWCKDGYYLDGRYTFTFDPLFHAGCYYVQEASSMFLAQVLKQYVNDVSVMLDLCAAPGGKSTLARSVLPEGSLLVANEVMRNRSQILAENIIKWGNPYTIVTNNDPADFTPLGPVFDVLLTDVPCSGEGMFRKDQVAVDEWSEDNVMMCAQRQQKILKDIWPCLKSGGLLIYSTCTYNREENEDNVEWIARELGAEILPVGIEDSWNITGNITEKDFPVYRFLPHKTKGEGLFMAVLRKTAEDHMTELPNKGRKDKKKQIKSGGKAVLPPDDVRQFIMDSSEFSFDVEGNVFRAFPEMYEDIRRLLISRLRVLHYGISMSELKGRDWSPMHALSMSTFLNREKFASEELDYEQAISYLRREAVTLANDVPRGYVLLTYRKAVLGFVKNIGNRANNMYPQEWRIRSGYLPEDLRILNASGM